MYTNSLLHIVGVSEWATAVQTAPILDSVHVLLSTVYILDGSRLCLFRKECIRLLFYLCFLLLCKFRSRYCVSVCCSVYCLCVNVYCTTATGCQPNCN